jgi:hypothetical protein
MSAAIIGPCETCQGEGKLARADAGEVRACFSCNGFRKCKRGYGAYKTQAQADRYGVPCRSCTDGTWTAPDTNPCHSCNYNPGIDIAVAHPGDVLPDVIGRCASVPRAVAESLAAEWSIVPMWFDRGQTFGEAYLGLGSIYSVTDYGAAWSQDGDAIVERVRESLASDRIQWISIMDSERTITRTIVVRVTRGGYSVIGSADVPRPMLPPTYTDEAMNRIV